MVPSSESLVEWNLVPGCLKGWDLITSRHVNQGHGQLSVWPSSLRTHKDQRIVLDIDMVPRKYCDVAGLAYTTLPRTDSIDMGMVHFVLRVEMTPTTVALSVS